MTVCKLVYFLVVFGAWSRGISGTASPELLQNGGFEQDASHWETCYNYHCEITSDSHSGSKAMKVTGRTRFDQGPRQRINVPTGKRYRAEGWVKLLNSNSNIFQHAEIEVAEVINRRTLFKTVARQPLLTAKDGWVHLAGDFITEGDAATSASVYVQGPDPGIDFILDDMSLNPIPENRNWKKEADERIEQIRKSNVTLSIEFPSGVNFDNIRLEIKQTSNGFPFGTEVNANHILSTTALSRKYTQFLYNNYNWGEPGDALTWNHFETQRGHPDWNWGEAAVKELLKNGMKVRAKNMLSAQERNAPTWLMKLTGEEFKAAVTKHVRETGSRYKGLVKHWVVNNELLHENWYESKVNDTSYTKTVFRLLHEVDPEVKLFLDDYDAVISGGTTEAYTQQAIDYRDSNTYIYGMGVQVHGLYITPPDPTLIKKRLDTLAQAKLPIWCTALNMRSPLEEARADYYDIALRVLFSHPAVEGIIMWGFWSEAHALGDIASLVSGPEFRVNAAGKRYIDLIKRQWRTHIVDNISGPSYEFRGFHGDYSVNLWIEGALVKTQKFTLGKSPAHINIVVDHVNPKTQ